MALKSYDYKLAAESYLALATISEWETKSICKV